MGDPMLYSVRMRASCNGRHLSGAERIVQDRLLAETVQQIVRRALGKGLPAEQVFVTIETVPANTVRSIRALDLIDLPAGDVPACRMQARRVLERTGVAAEAIDAAMNALDRGPAPSGGNMRGAMIMDRRTGERLEEDHDRGIRASRFDWSEEASADMDRALAAMGLTHVRTKEALALASKVARAPGIIAELCWSDDAGYTAGYVAGPSCGYVRFRHLKRAVVPFGGRAFFIEPTAWDYDAFRTYLQETPVLITTIGKVRSGSDADYGTAG